MESFQDSRGMKFDRMEVIARPNYTDMLKFERDFNHHESKEWMEENWTVSFYYVGAYLLFIFLGTQWMQNRPRFELRGPLIFWNFFLAIFSIFGTYRTLPEILYILNRNNGFHHSVCYPR
jgi:elongation of very long chain fatty acids protein 6